jgi:PIN domain nuclease of toxin-antitoxin system
MSLLLDTHAFLWWITKSPRLSAVARAAVLSADGDVLVSAATVWEIAIKAALGKIELLDDPAVLVPDQIAQHGFTALAVDMRHALRVFSLPPLHRDPFDRMLVAQSQIEGVPIVTADPLIASYDVPTIW